MLASWYKLCYNKKAVCVMHRRQKYEKIRTAKVSIER